ncbi:MAG: SDR family NAD(P)-dependent oxidoreductase [Actinomycetota bacterium]|nr:SDR family NAD(P)-dependent oxidoreductase [Actinomycetota bacterium]
MIGAALDTALDLSVLGGYTRVGYRLRRPWFDRLGSMRGRTVLVTGATSGLGLAAAEGFAALGADLWLLARDRERGLDARAAVAERAEGDVRLEICDLAALDSVRAFAQRFTAQVPRLDVLVNNAGVMTAERELSADGIELTFAVNVVAGFALTDLLLGALRAAAPGPGRVINVSSGGMYAQRLRADDLQSEHGDFDGTAAYARSKRAEVVLTELWAQRLAPTGITVNAMHPGWADTPGVKSSLPGFYRITKPLLRTPAQGADTIVWLGSGGPPPESSGGFWHDRRRRPVHLLPRTTETAGDRERLWAECERLAARSAPRADADQAARR